MAVINRQIAFGIVLFLGLSSAYYVLPIIDRCEMSRYTEATIKSSLSLEEQKTLKGVPTLSDETSYCPINFEYTQNGKYMSASAVGDIIHGTKIFYEDLSQYMHKQPK